MKEEEAARVVLAILKEQGFEAGDVAHANDITPRWILRGGGVTDLNQALRICEEMGWLTNDTGGHVLTAAGLAQ